MTAPDPNAPRPPEPGGSRLTEEERRFMLDQADLMDRLQVYVRVYREDGVRLAALLRRLAGG